MTKTLDSLAGGIERGDDGVEKDRDSLREFNHNGIPPPSNMSAVSCPTAITNNPTTDDNTITVSNSTNTSTVTTSTIPHSASTEPQNHQQIISNIPITAVAASSTDNSQTGSEYDTAADQSIDANAASDGESVEIEIGPPQKQDSNNNEKEDCSSNDTGAYLIPMSSKDFVSLVEDEDRATSDVEGRSNADSRLPSTTQSLSNTPQHQGYGTAYLSASHNIPSSKATGAGSSFRSHLYDSVENVSSTTSLSSVSSASSVELMDLQLTKLKTSTKFSYATLVAVVLGDCCRCKVSNEDESVQQLMIENGIKVHEKFLKGYLRGLKNHLELPESIEDSLYTHAIAEDSTLLIPDYVVCLESDPILANYGKPSMEDGQKDEPGSDLCKKVKSMENCGTSILVLDILQVSIRKGAFDSRSREMCIKLNKALGYEHSMFEQHEMAFVDFMQNASEHYQMSAEEKKAQEKSKTKSKRKRFVAIGLAALGGGALIGLTGGLAAPLVAGGLGAILGTAGATFLASTAGIAVITSVFGAGGAGLVGYKMKRRVGDVEQFQFSSLSSGVGLHITIAISGWVREGEVISEQWSSLDISPEQYCLMWETKYLLELGMSLEYFKDMVVNAAMSQALRYTVLSSVLAAIAWPAALLGASSVIDNPWSVANSRSVQAGKQLAEVLLTRQHGSRPVTLVGVSLGAKLIYHCLEEMSTRGSSALGIIHNVVLIGAPCSGRADDWAVLSPLISGQITNAYSAGDWMLKFIYRSSSMRIKIAGLSPIPLEPKVHNVDLTETVTGHLDYLDKMDEVLFHCGVKCKFDKKMKNKFCLAKKMTGTSSNDGKESESVSMSKSATTSPLHEPSSPVQQQSPIPPSKSF